MLQHRDWHDAENNLMLASGGRWGIADTLLSKKYSDTKECVKVLSFGPIFRTPFGRWIQNVRRRSFAVIWFARRLNPVIAKKNSDAIRPTWDRKHLFEEIPLQIRRRWGCNNAKN
jgi:hypothetical protein